MVSGHDLGHALGPFGACRAGDANLFEFGRNLSTSAKTWPILVKVGPTLLRILPIIWSSSAKIWTSSANIWFKSVRFRSTFGRARAKVGPSPTNVATFRHLCSAELDQGFLGNVGKVISAGLNGAPTSPRGHPSRTRTAPKHLRPNNGSFPCSPRACHLSGPVDGAKLRPPTLWPSLLCEPGGTRPPARRP